MDEKLCLICKTKLTSDSVKISSIGLASLVSASKIRSDGLAPLFQEEAKSGMRLHSACRKNYTRNTTLKKILNEAEKCKGNLKVTVKMTYLVRHSFLCSRTNRG